MSLDEFKFIFYWEYFHRILARIIGLFFLIPLIFFFLTKKIEIKYIKTCFVILFLIILQGFIGWYMVKSGLVNDTTVSHYRLSLHLVTAFIIISTIFWLIKNILSKNNKFFFNLSNENFPFLILIFLIFTQIIFGAFVSLDGKNGQTCQKDNNFFPDDVFLDNFLMI